MYVLILTTDKYFETCVCAAVTLIYILEIKKKKFVENDDIQSYKNDVGPLWFPRWYNVVVSR